MGVPFGVIVVFEEAAACAYAKDGRAVPARRQKTAMTCFFDTRNSVPEGFGRVVRKNGSDF